MTEEFDQLKALQADERVNLSSNYVDLYGLDELRAHQRGEKVGKPDRSRKQRKKLFTPEQLEDMAHSRDSLSVIARRCQTTKETVRSYRSSARNPTDK